MTRRRSIMDKTIFAIASRICPSRARVERVSGNLSVSRIGFYISPGDRLPRTVAAATAMAPRSAEEIAATQY